MPDYKYRIMLVLLVVLILPGRSSAMERRERPAGFGFEDAVAKARDLGQKPFHDIDVNIIPEFLRKIGYDQWRDIRYSLGKSLWNDDKLHFQIRFFHPGFLYNRPVTINIVDERGVSRMRFSPHLFDYGNNDFKDRVPEDLGFAGFRIHYPVNKKGYYDEVAAFLGASYFRAVAEDTVYGISARGIAIDTAQPGGEEFAFFREFWIVKPAAGARSITVYALLDSPSLAGAYEFVIHPGKETTIGVKARIFARKRMAKIGLAPQSSMFLRGENSNSIDPADFRPEVHDSDGLAIAFASGEYLWRPAVNPKRIFINTFQADGIRGFGLMQRDANFDHYHDLETRQEKRPSLWIVPGEEWRGGAIELIQIPTPDEYNDNLVAFWVPPRRISESKEIALSYSMKWGSHLDRLPPLGYVTGTRVLQLDGSRMQCVIDFSGGELQALSSDAEINADISVNGGGYRWEKTLVEKNSVTGGWRLIFQIQSESRSKIEKIFSERRETIELRATLIRNGRPLTETWSYGIEP